MYVVALAAVMLMRSYGPPDVVPRYTSKFVSPAFCVQFNLVEVSERPVATRLVAADGFGVPFASITVKFGEKS